MNGARSAEDIRLGFSVCSVCRRFFAIEAEYLGYLNHTDDARRSLRALRPLVDAHPRSDAAVYFARIARKLLEPRPSPRGVHGVKPLAEQDHYEALDVSPSATREEIERAYHLAKATYADDSLAGYSVFQEGEIPLLRERLEHAYRTLSDQDARRAYDEELARPTAHLRDEPEQPPAVVTPRPPDIAATMLPPPLSFAGDLDEEEREEDDGEFDGARLERLRVRRGIELDEIAGVTKVNPSYLRFIEEERFDDLPGGRLRARLRQVLRALPRPRSGSRRAQLHAPLRGALEQAQARTLLAARCEPGSIGRAGAQHAGEAGPQRAEGARRTEDRPGS